MARLIFDVMKENFDQIPLMVEIAFDGVLQKEIDGVISKFQWHDGKGNVRTGEFRFIVNIPTTTEIGMVHPGAFVFGNPIDGKGNESILVEDLPEQHYYFIVDGSRVSVRWDHLDAENKEQKPVLDIWMEGSCLDTAELQQILLRNLMHLYKVTIDKRIHVKAQATKEEIDDGQNNL